MKKILGVLLSVSAFFCMLAGCGNKTASSNELNKILEQGYITMATDAAWAPYEYIGKGGEPDGCDIEMGKAIAEALGVELKVINVAFDTLSTYVNSGEADMILAAMTITDERKETLDFSIPYTVAKQYIIVTNDNDSVKTIEDLAGYAIGVHLGTTGDFLICDEVDLENGVLNGTGASYSQYKALTDGCMDLKNGVLGAIVCDGPLAENLCRVNDGLKCFELAYADGSSTDEEYGIAVKKGNTALLEKINEIVEPIVVDGTFDEFFVKHVELSSLANE